MDLPVTFVDAVKRKYASDQLAHNLWTPRQSSNDSSIRISGKEVEEVGFEKIARRLANLKALRILLVDTARIHRPEARATEAGPANSDLRSRDVREACPAVVELDLSRNLFEEWAEITDICRQLPHLNNLRLDGNRFQSVSTPGCDISLRQAPFAHLTSLSLDDTLLSWEQVRHRIVWLSNCYALTTS